MLTVYLTVEIIRDIGFISSELSVIHPIENYQSTSMDNKIGNCNKNTDFVACEGKENAITVFHQDKRTKIKRKIKAMKIKEIQEFLQEFNEDVRNGTRKDLCKHLKEVCSSNQLAEELLLEKHLAVKCPFKYIFVIDFEATCDESKTFYPHEIIEFPVALIDTDKLQIVDNFHSYVKPVLNPVLTDFCTSLTGITQEIVDGAESFVEVLQKFCIWKMKCVKLDQSYAILTDGPYDMERFLVLQCIMSQIDYPSFGKRWINIKSLFSKTYGVKKLSLSKMLKFFGMEFEGKLHSGKDDACNIARLTLRMLQDDVQLRVNESITLEQIKIQLRWLSSYRDLFFSPIKIGRSSKRLSEPCTRERSDSKHADKKTAIPTTPAECEVDPAIAGSEFILLKNKKNLMC